MIQNNIKKKIFIISGFSDIEISGNQSMKNNIKYFSSFGYKVFVFSFFPKNYTNLQDSNKIFDSNVNFYRAPAVFSPLLYFGKRVKDFLGRDKKIEEKINILKPNQVEEYYAGYTFVYRIIHIITLFFFYLPIESLRIFIYYFKEKPDIFYGINWQGAIVASLLGKFLKKSVVNRFHGTTLKPEDIKKIKQRILLIDEILALKASCDAVIMLNDGTRGDKVLRLLGVPEEKIYFWRNGVDVNNLTLPIDWNPEIFKRELNLNNKEIIIMVSRLAAWKRVERGIYCVYKLIKEYKFSNIVLLIIGDGPQRKVLEKLVEWLGIKNSVQFLGLIPHREVAKYYSITNLFLSLYDITNLGNPVLEALYFGIPIITISDEGTRQLLEDGYNSLLIKPKNLERDLPVKVKLLLENNSLREKIKKNARLTFEEKVLTWEQRMRLEDRLIKRILKK